MCATIDSLLGRWNSFRRNSTSAAQSCPVWEGPLYWSEQRDRLAVSENHRPLQTYGINTDHQQPGERGQSPWSVHTYP